MRSEHKMMSQEARALESVKIVGMALVALVAMSPASARAQDFMQGTRAAGMGEAFTAVSNGTGGIYNNPAGVARSIMYTVDGTFQYTPTGTVLGFGIVDSKTNPSVSAGFGLNYYFARANSPDITALDLRLPLAIPVVAERIAIGLGGRYLTVTQSVENADGSKTDVELLSGFTLDAGGLFRVADEFYLGIAAKNLIDPCEKPERCRTIAPLTIGGGLAYDNRELVISADVDADLGSKDEAAINFGVGAEYLIEGMIPIRLGFMRRGAAEQNRFTVGSGWVSKTASVEASYQHNLTDSKLGLLSLGVSVYF
jgi:hypothetical protein